MLEKHTIVPHSKSIAQTLESGSGRRDPFTLAVELSDLDLSPTGERDRWWKERATGLLEHERAMVMDHGRHAEDEIPQMTVWPSWRDEDTVRLVGICPHCQRTHIFGLSSNPYREADGKSIRLVVEDDEMPDHVRFAIRAEADDLRNAADFVEKAVTYFEKINALNTARKRVGRRDEVSPELLAFALDAFLSSGVAADTLARSSADTESDLRTLLEFINGFEGRSFGRKLSNALKRAKLALANGELL